MKKEVFVSLALSFCFSVYGQEDTVSIPKDTLHQVFDSTRFIVPELKTKSSEVYTLKPAVDVPLTLAGTGWSLYAFTKIYSKDTSPVSRIEALNKYDVAPYNRSAINHYSTKAFDASNAIFYGSMPLPLFLLLDKKIRKDAGKVGLLFMESMSITGMLYTGSVYFKDKYRPYAYNPEVDINRRVRGGAKNSFFAGHVALVGTSTFFMAKVLSDYHPESKIKWLYFGMAGLATGTIGYLRYRAGEHFLSDVAIGAAIGTLTGVLVPHFHKTKNVESRVSLRPFYGRTRGAALVYRF